MFSLVRQSSCFLMEVAVEVGLIWKGLGVADVLLVGAFFGFCSCTLERPFMVEFVCKRVAIPMRCDRWQAATVF